MKKFLVLFIISTMILIGCGGGTKDTAATSDKKSEPVKKVKKETVVTMKIGEDELKFRKASFISAAMTPADKTTKYSLYGKLEGGDETDLYIKFDSAVKGEPQEAYINLQNKLQNYEILKSELILENFEDRKHAVTAVRATFSGQLKKNNENGFPTGDPIDFTGTFEK